jgi:hypothetical protein
MDIPQLLTIREVEVATRYSAATVFRYIEQGRLTAVRVAGTTRVTLDSLNRLIESGSTAAAPDDPS